MANQQRKMDKELGPASKKKKKNSADASENAYNYANCLYSDVAI